MIAAGDGADTGFQFLTQVVAQRFELITVRHFHARNSDTAVLPFLCLRDEPVDFSGTLFQELGGGLVEVREASVEN